MTDADHPITVGQKGWVKALCVVIAVSLDAALVMAAKSVLNSAPSQPTARVLGLLVVIVLAGVALTWIIWRMARLRVEISEDGIVNVGLFGRQLIPTADVRRVDVMDGRDLRPPLTGFEGESVYLPVVLINIAPGKLPVKQLSAHTRKDAEVNAVTLRRLLERAAPKTTPLDTADRPEAP